MVFVDCGNRIDGLCGDHALDRETLWPLLEIWTLMMESALPGNCTWAHHARGAAVSEDRGLRVSKFLVMAEQSPWPFSPA